MNTFKVSRQNLTTEQCDLYVFKSIPSETSTDLTPSLRPILDRKRWSHYWKLLGRRWCSAHCCHRNKHFTL